MGKQIHIHLPAGMAVTVDQDYTRDAGFDESKVKRDEGGKFSHSAAAAEHRKQAEHHYKQANSAPPLSPAESEHEDASIAHTKAARMHERAHEDPVHADRAHAASKVAHSASKRLQPLPPPKRLSERQQALREMGSPRYSGRTPANPSDTVSPEQNAVPRAAPAKVKGAEELASEARMTRLHTSIQSMKKIRVSPSLYVNHLRDIASWERQLQRLRDEHASKFGNK